MGPVGTATMSIALVSSGGALADVPRPMSPPVARLASEMMPGDIQIWVSMAPVEMQADIAKVIHASVLRSFEHLYDF